MLLMATTITPASDAGTVAVLSTRAGNRTLGQSRDGSGFPVHGGHCIAAAVAVGGQAEDHERGLPSLPRSEGAL